MPTVPGMPLEARLRALELEVQRLSRQGQGTPRGGTGGGGGVGLLPEARVVFDPEAGHDHDGAGSAAIDHANLENVTADQHHAQSHVLAGTGGLGPDHTVSGLTQYQVLQATGPTGAAFAQLSHDVLGNVTADQHHAQSHVLASTSTLGIDHTVSGLTVGQVLRAKAANDACFAVLSHGDLTGVGANDHHSQQHSLTGSDHTASGLTTGHVLTATGATSFAFQAPAAADNAWSCLAIWGKLDISTVGTSFAQMNMPNHGGGGTDVLLPQPRAGKVMAVSAALDAAISGAGSYLVEVYSGPVGSLAATGIGVTLDSATRRAYDTDASGVAFSAGDIVVPYHRRSGSITNTPTSIVWVWVKYD